MYESNEGFHTIKCKLITVKEIMSLENLYSIVIIILIIQARHISGVKTSGKSEKSGILISLKLPPYKTLLIIRGRRVTF